MYIPIPTTAVRAKRDVRVSRDLFCEEDFRSEVSRSWRRAEEEEEEEDGCGPTAYSWKEDAVAEVRSN